MAFSKHAGNADEMMIIATQFASSAVFGASMYESICSSPAREEINEDQRVIAWRGMFLRAIKFMMAFGVPVMGLSAALFFRNRTNKMWLVVGGAYVLNNIWTYAGIMPINWYLLDENNKRDAPEALTKHKNWVKVHNVRTALYFVAAAASFAACFKRFSGN